MIGFTRVVLLLYILMVNFCFPLIIICFCVSLTFLYKLFNDHGTRVDFFVQESASRASVCFSVLIAWEEFRDLIPENERGSLVDAYHKRLNSDNLETQVC